MSSVPRGTAERVSRVSARVPARVKADLETRVSELRLRGLAVTTTELVELALDAVIARDADDLDAAIRQRRTAAEGATIR